MPILGTQNAAACLNGRKTLKIKANVDRLLGENTLLKQLDKVFDQSYNCLKGGDGMRFVLINSNIENNKHSISVFGR